MHLARPKHYANHQRTPQYARRASHPAMESFEHKLDMSLDSLMKDRKAASKAGKTASARPAKPGTKASKRSQASSNPGVLCGNTSLL